ncbi:MAG: septal ring lytic transglycosylase RlpA family protein [Acidobacteriota bacterium]|nr:MAG: septal ring lytic transglycosylase RlpA family protein [Acidobacteriota bacterium]
MKYRLGLLVGLVLVTGACGKKAAVQVPTASIERRQEGLASWYGKGDGYQGKRTASGEKFDRNKLTAAHYSLPLGTKVRVLNKKNGRKVVVKINDRFPIETLRKGRIIDLSYKAAQKLEMVRDGVVPVLLEVLSLPDS